MPQSLRGIAKLTTKSAKATKATKGDENIYEDSFMLFASFVVKRIFGCGQRPCCVLRGEPFPAGIS
jgi:hypothetical protein